MGELPTRAGYYLHKRQTQVDMLTLQKKTTNQHSQHKQACPIANVSQARTDSRPQPVWAGSPPSTTYPVETE